MDVYIIPQPPPFMNRSTTHLVAKLRGPRRHAPHVTKQGSGTPLVLKPYPQKGVFDILAFSRISRLFFVISSGDPRLGRFIRFLDDDAVEIGAV